MQGFRKSKGMSYMPVRSAAEDAATKRGKDATTADEQAWENEGGHADSPQARITRVASAELPYVVILGASGSDAGGQRFATMREAEAFMNRNTPVRAATLSLLYDRPAGG